MAEQTHYQKLRKFFPRRYLLDIEAKTGASISLINKVLRNERKDTKGILVEAYSIANLEKERQIRDAKKLATLQQSLKELKK